jgi:transposase
MESNLIERNFVVGRWLKQHVKDIPEIARESGQKQSFVKKWVARYLSTGGVHDLPRSGRKIVFAGKDLRTAKRLIEKKKVSSSLDISTHFSGKYSPATVRRGLVREGWEFCVAQNIPKVTPSQRKRRVRFSKKHSRTSWKGVMFTDSKIFPLSPSMHSAKLKYWAPKGSHVFQECSRDARKVHVYGGATAFGLTDLHFATPTTGQTKFYFNKKTGEKYKGVSSAEYQDVLQKLLADGDRLFKDSKKWADEWVYQQDGASSHTAVPSLSLLRELMPGRILEDWPANSPDLSWIENIWAIVDRRLRKQEYNDIDEFKAALLKIWREIDHTICQNAVAGMANRFTKCIANEGGYIGK